MNSCPAERIDEGLVASDLNLETVAFLGLQRERIDKVNLIDGEARIFSCNQKKIEKNNQNKTLSDLIEFENYPFCLVEMDEAYFNDREIVKADLNGFAIELGVEDPLRLNCGKKTLQSKLICCNGELIPFELYLTKACIALGFAASAREARSKFSFTLNYLLKEYFEKRIIDQMNLKYFENQNNIKEDLNAYVKVLDLKTVFELNCSDQAVNSLAKCQNGEQIRFLTYLCRFGVAMKIFPNFRQAQLNLAMILKFILERYFDKPKIQEMDDIYFKSAGNIKFDFNGFAQALGLKNVYELDCSDNALSATFKCNNGEIISFRTYLYRFGIKLNLILNAQKIGVKKAIILNYLLETYFEKPKIAEMDRAYLENLSNLQYDFNSYASAFNLLNPSEINCSRANLLCSTFCRNGENRTFRSYLLNAEKKLGIISKTKSKYTKILRYLLEIAFPPQANQDILSDSEDSTSNDSIDPKEVLIQLRFSKVVLSNMEKAGNPLPPPKAVKKKVNELLLRGFINPIEMMSYLPSLIGYRIEKIDSRIEALRRAIYTYQLEMDAIIEFEKHPNWFVFSPERFNAVINIALEKAKDKTEITAKRIATMFSYNFECLTLAAANSNDKGLAQVVRDAHELDKQELPLEEKRKYIANLPDSEYKIRYFKIYPDKAA